ncbi:MAG: phospholipid carrier-dependent glycosyltransferase [Candidatus Daviesbacteria bacterium]|nr:phospholipid carrier-dependent glycosyltransferase [Candidatus Daviesbacteria bacterium]
MYKKVNIFSFCLILLVAFFLRFYQINNIPPSLNWDEVSIGYNAYSILKTGRDEWGQFLPLSFRAFGDYKLPLYIYLDAPFVALLGLTEAAVRLPSVLSGMGVVVLVFLILKELTKSFYLSLWGMFISATLPWLVVFSRIALEANLALFLTTASFYLLLLARRKKILLFFSAVLLGLSIFSYNSSRVLVILFLLLGIVFYRNFKKKEILLPLVIIIIFILIAFFQAVTVDSGARYKWTTILDEGAITRINQLRGLSGLPSLLNQLIHNKATYFITEASKNYIYHFDPYFLFINGGSNFQFSIPGSGQIYLSLLPLIVLGIWKMMCERKGWQLFILGWLLISPIPGAITRDAPHSLRAIFMTVPLVLIAVMGIKRIQDSISGKIFILLTILMVLLLSISAFVFWQNYGNDYQKNYSWSWQYGYKQVMEFVHTNGNNYDRIIFTKRYGEPHEFLLFYLQYDPLKYQTNETLIRYERSDWFWVDRFDKFEFINDWEIKDKVLGANNTLLITSPGNYPIGSQVLETIKFLDGKAAFDIAAVN